MIVIISFICQLFYQDNIEVLCHFRELGITTLSKCENELQEFLNLAQGMFDTKLPADIGTLQPFTENSTIKKIAVQVSS